MLKLNLSAATQVAANTAIPYNLVDNTNGKISYKNGVITFLQPGQYRIEGTNLVTGIASGNVQLNLLNGTTVIPAASTGGTSSASTDLITLPISYAIEIESQSVQSYASVSLQLSVAATINVAAIAVTYIS